MTDAIDIFCHWAPPDYGAAALAAAGRPVRMLERALALPVMTDVGARLRLMDRFPGYRQMPCLMSPPLETLAGPRAAADLAQRANDGMATLAARHPNRFPGFFASIAANHPDAMLAEACRAVTDLGARGVQIFTSVGGAAIDSPTFMDLFALIAELDRAVLLHPTLGFEAADYTGEPHSKYELWWALGWPYETSKAMYRLVFAGVFDRWPDLKIITHHGGGLIPVVEGRLGLGLEAYGSRTPPDLHEREQTPLRGEPLAAFRRFYTDTATFGSAAGVASAVSFFGIDRVLFASDMPFGPNAGADVIAASLEAVNALQASPAEIAQILSGNAERLLSPASAPRSTRRTGSGPHCGERSAGDEGRCHADLHRGAGELPGDPPGELLDGQPADPLRMHVDRRERRPEPRDERPFVVAGHHRDVAASNAAAGGKRTVDERRDAVGRAEDDSGPVAIPLPHRLDRAIDERLHLGDVHHRLKRKRHGPGTRLIDLDDRPAVLLHASTKCAGAGHEQGVVGLGVDDHRPAVPLRDRRLGGEPADDGVVGIDHVARGAEGPPEHPHQLRLAERQPQPLRECAGHVPLHRGLREHPVELHPPQRSRRLGRVRHVDDHRVRPRLGERLLRAMDRLGHDRQARERAIDAEHRDRNPLTGEWLRVRPHGMAAERPVAEPCCDGSHMGYAGLARLWVPTESPTCRARGDARLAGDVANRDAHAANLVVGPMGCKPAAARSSGGVDCRLGERIRRPEAYATLFERCCS
jgi:aminocarboxymuconate-semialdehyde decarboxylase